MSVFPSWVAGLALGIMGTLFCGEAHALGIRLQRILGFARMHRLPTVCGVRAYAKAGCLIAYAPKIDEMFRRATVFVDQILKGAKPAGIPMELPHKLELFLNLKTSDSLGVTFPQMLLLADEVIR